MKETISLTVLTILMLLVFTQVAVGQTGTEAEEPKTDHTGMLLEVTGITPITADGGRVRCALTMTDPDQPDGEIEIALEMSASEAAWFEVHEGENMTVWWKLEEGGAILLGARINDPTSIFSYPSGFAPGPPAEYEGP
jgi:hypothetical protein